MSYAEDILRLRKRVADAVSRGIVDTDGKGFLEATLIQIMNDAEKNRQNCLTQAENLRRQAGVFDGQAGAYASVVSIVYNVINGYVLVAEKEEAERNQLQADKETAAAAEETPAPTTEVKKKSGKKNR